MDLTTAKQIVAEWLEEWRPPDLIPRDSRIPEPAQPPDILAIVGPRRAGKTFFMFQLIGELVRDQGCRRDDILFVDFEDYRLSGLSARDVEHLFVAFHQLAGKHPRYLFFDEVQQLPEWSRVLRTLHNQRKYRIVVSGSNSRLLSGEVAPELRGRYRDLVMLPFSFREYLRYHGIKYSRRTLYTTARGKLVGAFDDYLTMGGFPEVLHASSRNAKRQVLQSYFRTIFYRDILERHNIKARAVLEAMLRSSLSGYAALFSVSRMEKQLQAADLSVSKRTISNYLSYLQEAFFIHAHEKFSFSPRKRAMNPKKIYLVDPGFTTLSGEATENRGRMLENLVALELHRRGRESYYHKGAKECDFILTDDGRPYLAIQVCWRLEEANIPRECAGLAEAMRAWKIENGLILTYEQDQSVQWRGPSYPVKPVWKWLLEDEVETGGGKTFS